MKIPKLKNKQYTNLCPIYSGVPQGTVLDPILYLLYTADIPTMNVTTTTTFADDTDILTSHNNAGTASKSLQKP